MLVAIGRIVDKNNMIEGLRIYDTKAKTSKDIRIEYVPKNVVNLNQANKLGTINKDGGEEKPVILLDIRNNLAHIVNVNGEEKTVTSISELNRYTVIRCKSDVELYKEYIQKTQETRLKFKIENGKVSIVNFETNNRGIEVVEIPSFVSNKSNVGEVVKYKSKRIKNK